jgi:hypothetical protein
MAVIGVLKTPSNVVLQMAGLTKGALSILAKLILPVHATRLKILVLAYR